MPFIHLPIQSGSNNILKKETVDLSLLNVSGIFEIPIAVRKNIHKFDAFIALGCVIKGKTPHFNYICKSTFDAIINLSNFIAANSDKVDQVEMNPILVSEAEVIALDALIIKK